MRAVRNWTGVGVAAVLMTAVTMLPASAAPAIGVSVGVGGISGSVRVTGTTRIYGAAPVYVTSPLVLSAPQPVFVPSPEPVYVPVPQAVPVPVAVQPAVVRVLAPGLPDLVILNHRITWVRDGAGVLRRVVLFEVQNAGGTPAAACLASVSIDNAMRYAPIPSLQPGESASIAVETNGPVSPGALITITADCRQDLVEQNKSNNRLVARWIP